MTLLHDVKQAMNYSVLSRLANTAAKQRHQTIDPWMSYIEHAEHFENLANNERSYRRYKDYVWLSNFFLAAAIRCEELTLIILEKGRLS